MSTIDDINEPVGQWIEKNGSEDLILDWQKPWLEICLNRPSRKNALNGAVIQKLKSIFEMVESHHSIRAIILTGGKQQFCAGADLQEIAALRARGPEALIQNNKNYGELLHRIHLCRVPVICLVDGPALGGGMGLACASDIICCTPQALFGMPEPKLGIIAGQIFPYVYRKLGLVRTQEMSLQGLNIKGEQAQDWGFVNHLCADYTDLTQTRKTILEHIACCGPEAIAKTKVMLNLQTAISHQMIEQTAREVIQATLSAEGVEGGAAFIAKRKPQW